MNRYSRILTLSLTPIFTHVAAGERVTDESRNCDAHAAAMVAEIQASSAMPLSADERALVRRTAMKSCLSQTAASPAAVTHSPAAPGGTPAEAASSVAAAAPAPKSAPAAVKKTEDRGFLGAFDALIEGGRERTDGHKRLRRRGR